ncbi:MAG: DNA methyltransferase [Candidatus Bathyarchaeota archaeon]|nr:DNA methyltransferase [Candidatus Bathyarchaeota archaeon]
MLEEISQVTSHIFVSSAKTEKECMDRMLFGTSKVYGDDALAVKKGDLIFLLNIDSNVLHGVFRAKSDGKQNIVPEAWKGKYPYQVAVEQVGNLQTLKKARVLLKKLGVVSHKSLSDAVTKRLLNLFTLSESDYLKQLADSKTWGLLTPDYSVNGKTNGDTSEEKPKLESTTLWDFPRQSYGKTPKGNNKYAGVTPAFVIWNMVQRYTEPGDLVLDPMCGSGTTLDVCREEGRKAIGFDISPPPYRSDIKQNDARHIPLANDSVDMIFIDSPYGDNIRYNEHPDNIGHISSEKQEFYDALEKVMDECYRVLKPGKVIGWLIGDQWVKKRFTPVGFKVYERLCKNFETVDIICVVRRSQASNTPFWHSRAKRYNFYLRGFKYLFIMRKPSETQITPVKRSVKWAYYDRSKNNEKK